MSHRFKHRANARSRRSVRVRAGLLPDPLNRVHGAKCGRRVLPVVAWLRAVA